MLKFGWSEVSITPDRPIGLAGQFYERISHGVETPITVTAWAVQSPDDSMIICSCDLVSIGENLLEAVRDRVKEANTEIDTDKIILSAIHSHTSHVYDRGDSGFKRFKDIRQRFRCVLGVIVEKHDRAVCDLTCNPFVYAVRCGAVLPIKRVNRPLYRVHI